MTRFNVWLGWILLLGSLLGWFGSLAGLWFADEPIGILSLSWLALVLTGYDVLMTAYVRHRQEEDEE